MRGVLTALPRSQASQRQVAAAVPARGRHLVDFHPDAACAGIPAQEPRAAQVRPGPDAARSRPVPRRCAAAADAVARPCPVLCRDVKPANMLVARGGVVKLMDFGISELLTRVYTETFVSAQRPGAAGEQDLPPPHSERAARFGLRGEAAVDTAPSSSLPAPTERHAPFSGARGVARQPLLLLVRPVVAGLLPVGVLHAADPGPLQFRHGQRGRRLAAGGLARGARRGAAEEAAGKPPIPPPRRRRCWRKTSRPCQTATPRICRSCSPRSCSASPPGGPSQTSC